jgi:NAD(P)-dependent dehydrogenase (short-subunit alcohol dehydrogenase family)
MSKSNLSATTAIVTGASRGFGRAIATALARQGVHVIGVARSEAGLDDVQCQLGRLFTPVIADVTDTALAARLIAEYRPRTLVLNAGATPRPAPLQEQSWESFSLNWEVDVKQVFHFTRAALTAPLDPGSVVVSFSSGAALRGSPLSGGYAGAKATVRFLSAYAGVESKRHSLGLRFVSVLPVITPATDLGAPFVKAYADYAGITVEAYLAQFGEMLTAEQVATSVINLATDDGYTAPSYWLAAGGMKPLD